MKNNIKTPPASRQEAISGEKLADVLKVLIGQPISLKAQIRTIGSTLRKKIEAVVNGLSLSPAIDTDFSFSVKKGLPKIMLALSDSYIVTTGDKYNLQVWNRRPNSRVQLVKYNDGSKITCKDIRCILVKVDTTTETIESVVIMTPDYIEKHFGVFGVPTIKYQLIINGCKRTEILYSTSSMLIGHDSQTMKKYLAKGYVKPSGALSDEPTQGEIIPLDAIKHKVANNLVGKKLTGSDTKTRGQELERIVATLLGYDENDALVGGYPDIKNQALEVKEQESPTIDLGKESPSVPTKPYNNLDITTEDVRYLIGLVDPKSKEITGVVLMSGSEIVDEFSLVGDTSYKCQRTIPMTFFDRYKGKSVFNP